MKTFSAGHIRQAAIRHRLLLWLAAAFVYLHSFGSAQTTTSLDSMPARMHDVIVANEVPGAVTVVATRDSELRMDAQGWADPERKSFMRVDSIFWIASMSKPITATAVLMLMEEGKLSLDDPIAKYIPELAGLKTADGKTPRITLRHLLTHTSGMGEATDAEAKAARTLSALVPAFASKPLAFEPGSQWKYCQSGILTLGRIVEIVSGVPFEVFLRKRILDPLGMKDTTFYLSEAQVPAAPDNGIPSGSSRAEVALQVPRAFQSDKIDWHGFDRYDFVMDKQTLAIMPFKAPAGEQSGELGNSDKGQ